MPESFAELEGLASRARVVDQFDGEASYYGDSLAGNSMASGIVYSPNLACAAHRTLPFGTLLRVRRISNGAQVLVRVLDRGPFGSKRRVLDLSKAAAKRLGMLADGVTAVHVEVLDVPGEEL
ncbi:MAG: septal ring lytic transglycosylase RlpA family protein [Polyangiaceae bacterium]